MPAITFPTCNGPSSYGHVHAPGTPDRASACRCDQPLVDQEGECSRCGRYTQWTINDTWRRRAQQLREAA